MRDHDGSATGTAAARSKWTSKRTVLLLVLGGMALMFVGGVLFRIVHPTAEDRIVKDLPRYPGAREAGFPAFAPGVWTRYDSGFANGIVISYTVPRGTTRDDVLRYYGLHMPKSFTRDGASCWARGDARVLLLVTRTAAPQVDVAVATEGADCP